MNRIAVIADIHGNVPALEAVVADLREQAVDQVLVGGDLVGRGPEGGKVIKRIRTLGWPVISGNHEEYLLAFRRRQVPDEWWQREEWSAARFMAAELDPSDVDFIAALPFSLRPRHATDLVLVHGSPRSSSEGLGPWLSDDQMADHYRQVDERLLVCAHTHRPMQRRVDDGLVVNVGAVGLPFNRDQRAQYAIFTLAAGGWDTELRQVDYDLAEIFAIYDRSGFRAQGGITAELLRLELEHATPFLVPFLFWAEQLGRDKTRAELDAFLTFFDPHRPLRELFAEVRAEATNRRQRSAAPAE